MVGEQELIRVFLKQMSSSFCFLIIHTLGKHQQSRAPSSSLPRAISMGGYYLELHDITLWKQICSGMTHPTPQVCLCEHVGLIKNTPRAVLCNDVIDENLVTGAETAMKQTLAIRI